MTVADFRQARRENVSVLVSLAGASGSGKTFSAMQMAAGICGDEPFLVIDTEARRALHYADAFTFEHKPLTVPFNPPSYLAAVQAGAKRGFRCIVIDSMSHEWEGIGGVLDMAADDKGVPPSNWIKPKAAHRKMMNGLLQVDTNLIFCLRADEKIRVVDHPERPGKKLIESAGWTPIAEKKFQFEMTTSFTLSPAAPGIVDMSLPHKCQDQHRRFFPDGQHITREAGASLAAWAKGGDQGHPDEALWRRAREAANNGTVALRDFSQALSDDERGRVRPIGREINDTAKTADGNMVGQPDTGWSEDFAKGDET